jgi:predicted P-loop ATPase
MAINPAELTPDQRLRLIEGSLTASEVRGDNTSTTPIEQLAALLPTGFNDKGAPSPANAGALASMFSTLMETRPHLIRWNLMSQEVEINGQPLNPHQQECIYIPIQQQGWSAKKTDAKDALVMAASADAYHPVQDYLNSIRHTPQADITRLASTYLRPGDLNGGQTIYDRMLYKTLVGAVKRAYEPGCQHDTCCVLKGAQGLRKTTFWRTLFRKHFSIFRGKIGDKDALLTVHASWALELGELDSITSQTHAGHLKNFLTTETDHFRPPYGVKAAPCPRPSIFVGSCNRGDFLYDDTGERRWWIIPCEAIGNSKIDIASLALDIDAIWAAAIAAYEDGALTFLSDEDEALNADLNGDYTADNAAEAPVLNFLRQNACQAFIDPHELLKAVGDQMAGSISTAQLQRLAKDAMTRQGWSLRRGTADHFGPSRPRKWFKT